MRYNYGAKHSLKETEVKFLTPFKSWFSQGVDHMYVFGRML